MVSVSGRLDYGDQELALSIMSRFPAFATLQCRIR